MAKKGTLGGSEYTRSYGNFRGVELGNTGERASDRLAYAKNLYRDYEGASPSALESIPGFRRVCNVWERINAIYLHKAPDGDYLVVIAGVSVYRMPIKDIDSLEEPVAIAHLSGAKSAVFTFGSDLYLLDGSDIIRIDGAGSVGRIGRDIAPYVPTTFKNGIEYEQRNLLTDEFFESLIIVDPSEYEYSTGGLQYEIYDGANCYCKVTGIDTTLMLTGVIQIPGRVMLGDRFYTVKIISERAFSGCTDMSSLKILEGVEEIEDYAFFGCLSARKISLPTSLKRVGAHAFERCNVLRDVYLGKGIESFGDGCFDSCSHLQYLYYEGSEEEYSEVVGMSALEVCEKSFGVKDTAFTISIPSYSRANYVSSLKIGKTSKGFAIAREDGLVKELVVEIKGAYEVNGQTIEMYGTLPALYSDFKGGRDTNKTDGVPSFEAICGCTVAEAFDGRIFLSGNPKLPNTVFYTATDKTGANNPLYVGAYNYFCSGVGKYPVKSLLAVRDSLAVFKSGDDGSGSIFYHTPKDTSDRLVPRIYPVEYVHSGLCAVGESINFLDDPVFLSKMGLSALSKKDISYERSVVCRSHNVNFDLLSERLEDAHLAEWMGYLVVGIRDRAYLADSRQTFTHRTGNTEYEWFTLYDIGVYENSTRVYRYSSFAQEGFDLHPDADGIAAGTVMSEAGEGGEMIYYVSDSGKRYRVYPTDCFSGGSFSPATVYFASDELLFFGTECGVLCVFNNDKRGVAPKSLAESDEYDPEEYKARMARRIHPEFYSFDSHDVSYEMKTHYDDCGIPHLTKSSVKHSLCIKIEALASCELTVEVGTDKSGYSTVSQFPGGEVDFSCLDFGNMSLSCKEYFTLPVNEKEKGWIEKQVAVYAKGFSAPIGIHSITYRYYVKGRIKRTLT